jgi:hypothetical protein
MLIEYPWVHNFIRMHKRQRHGFDVLHTLHFRPLVATILLYYYITSGYTDVYMWKLTSQYRKECICWTHLRVTQVTATTATATNNATAAAATMLHADFVLRCHAQC